MKKLFIYYSFTGNGDEIASILKERGYEIRKVTEKNKMPKSFFMQMMVGGFRAGVNQKGKLIDYDNDISAFNEVIIGSPIWNGKFPPAINSVLALTDLKDKDLTFLIYSGSGEGRGALKRINNEYKDAKVIFLKYPKTHKEELEKIKNL